MPKMPLPCPNVIFVCTNKRPDGHPKPCCADAGGKQLRDELKMMAAGQGSNGQVRVFQSGCLGACEHGPVAMSFPNHELITELNGNDLEDLLNRSDAGQ